MLSITLMPRLTQSVKVLVLMTPQWGEGRAVDGHRQCVCVNNKWKNISRTSLCPWGHKHHVGCDSYQGHPGIGLQVVMCRLQHKAQFNHASQGQRYWILLAESIADGMHQFWLCKLFCGENKNRREETVLCDAVAVEDCQLRKWWAVSSVLCVHIWGHRCPAPHKDYKERCLNLDV